MQTKITAGEGGIGQTVYGRVQDWSDFIQEWAGE